MSGEVLTRDREPPGLSLISSAVAGCGIILVLYSTAMASELV